MHSSLLALASGPGSTLLWIALAGISAFALILYVPQRFSGPLTATERRSFGRVHRRTLLIALVAPFTTVLGFVLLLPPLVELHVAGHLPGPSALAEAGERSMLSYFASRRSTGEWMDAVRCHLGPGDQGADALAEAIVRAAQERFVAPEGCLSGRRPLDAWETTSIELSLVELAAKAYHLTGLHVSAGPRVHDPDPWDIMARRIEARGGPTPTLGRSRPAAPGESRILRLSHARLGDPARPPKLTVFALVEGPADVDFRGSLVTPDGRSLDSRCLLRDESAHGYQHASRRIVRMRVQCPSLRGGQALRDQTGGLLLVADDGETPIRSLGRLPLLDVDVGAMGESLALANHSEAFADELHRRGLAALRADTSAAIAVWLAPQTISVVRRDGNTRMLSNCDPQLDSGPFSWVGMTRPRMRFEPGLIEIEAGAALLDVKSDDYDPSAFLALIYTITWAANALDSGVCSETEAKLPVRRQAHPVLTAEQIDVAGAALRRDRDSFGLALLALALASLALGLRRSAA